MFRLLDVAIRTIAVPLLMFGGCVAGTSSGGDFELSVRQITSGPENHFFGYIGHVGTVPLNGDGRFIVALRTTFQDRMPGPDDPADVVLIDTQEDDRVRAVDQSRAWNPQQGTMLYWNPAAADTQFFFNDRDPETGKVFCVLFDIAAGPQGERVSEYRFEETPVGNGGVAQTGGHLLGINYARMARLRPVTGYQGAFDWTEGIAHPKDDGVFKVDVDTGELTLLVSFDQIAHALREANPRLEIPPLFINHTLWNREGDRIFFFARAGWNGKGTRIDQPIVMQPNGSDLRLLNDHIGGHPEWDYGRRLLGRLEDRQIVYDTDQQLVVAALGGPDIFPKPGGDIALSPNGRWFVNGYTEKSRQQNLYVVYRRRDGAYQRSPGFDIGQWTSGDLRLDPGPLWNRDNTKLLVPGLSDDGSRQLFLIEIHSER